MEIRDKLELMNTIECINKEYVNLPMGELEDFVVCTIKRDPNKTTLNIYQPDLITKMTHLK